MSPHQHSLLAISISLALFAPQLSAATQQDDRNLADSLMKQCKISADDTDSNLLPMDVEADNLEAINGDTASYTGNVQVSQGNKRIHADSVTYNQADNVIVANGDVTFTDGEMLTRSKSATNQLNSGQVTLEDTQYQFLCEPGRGEAAFVSKTGKAMYEIEDGSITSCPEGDSSWQLVASSISVDQNQELATLYNPRMQVQGVPIFYLPLLSVPIGDSRKTGFLYPTVSFGSNDGMEATIPIYWNLAPNYDLTTEFHYMEKRGTQLNSSFRYLEDFGTGTINFEYLPGDQKYSEDQDKDRWGGQITQGGLVANNWIYNIDYSKVSDIDYFSDLDSSIGSRHDGQLVQQASFGYRSDSWDVSLLARDFQILVDDDDLLPYRLMPQLSFNYYAPELMRYLNLDMKGSIAQFDTDASDKPSATRVHLEPGFSIPISTTWGSWITESRLLATYYHQDLDGVSDADLQEEVTRYVPEFRSHIGLVLERDTTLFPGYTETFEPQIQYLYVPEKDQSAIYQRYDTTLLQTDYYGLFRSRKYSSVDFIAPANQISYGATSRFLDENYKERLNISFGQILYLKSSYNQSNSEEPSNYSAWAVETDFNYDDRLFYHGGVQYDTATSSLQSANSALEYRYASGYLQTNYRYVDYDYIKNNFSNLVSDADTYASTLTEDGISQLGLLGEYKINRNWHAKGQYFYDLTTDNPLEWVANLMYRSDCWYIGFSYSRQLVDWETAFTDPTYENNLSINLGIIGFGTNPPTSISDGDSSLGYGNPFLLNN